MRTDIARLDVSMRVRSVIGYSAGMALYTLIVVALYPAFKDSTALDNLVKNDGGAAALFGISGPLSSSAGWLNANIFANFFPLLMLLMTVGYGAASIAGQDEDGTLCQLIALPRTRTSIVFQKVASMAIQSSVLAMAVAVCVVIGRAFQLTTSATTAIAASAAVLMMGIDFGIVSMAVGALTGRRGTAIGVGAGVAAASYLVSSLAPVISWLHPARFVSLFYWSVGNNQISEGVGAIDYLVLLGVGVCALAATLTAFRRLDVH